MLGKVLQEDIKSPVTAIKSFWKWTIQQKQNASERVKLSHRYEGHKNPRSKRIQFVETGEVFERILYAQEKYGVKWTSSFSIALDNPTRTAAGLHWVTYHDKLQVAISGDGYRKPE